ncbi:MAG TPA: SRPBCC domain-containing protein [Hanamia sp.]|nr:SRPBCC domain-containing protein [Hanamia sp.]
MNNPITVETVIKATAERVWKLWTTPADIIQWNNPSGDWQTLRVDNDLKIGGKFLFRMEAKDGSDGFDFGGKYDKVITNELIEYTLDDRRKTLIEFIAKDGSTILIETFDPEAKTPADIQRDFCQSVLNNFKRYVEKENNKMEIMITEISVEFGKTSDELIQLIVSTNEDHFNEIPFEGSWSAAQVGDHLLKSYGLVEVLSDGPVKQTERLPEKEIEQVKKIFLDFNAKYKSAETLLPTNESIEKEKLLSGLQKRISQIKEVIQTKDLTETCVGLPFNGIGELTRIEWLHVILFHTQRHIHQMKNILRSLQTIVNKES